MIIHGKHDDNTLEQMHSLVDRFKPRDWALMADGHFGYVMPVGGVAAWRSHIPPWGVGYDIACGNCAIRLDVPWDMIERYRDSIAAEIQSTFAFGVGGNNESPSAPKDHWVFDDPRWDIIPRGADKKWSRTSIRETARAQLGTIGSGNHYVDIFEDRDGFTWVGVHFGSRGFGHRVASGFIAVAAGKRWGELASEEDAGLLSTESWAGKDYIDLMQLAGDYARAGRNWVVEHIANMLGGDVTDYVHNHHNFAWLERHHGEPVWVVRKGATPAFPMQRGFVGGSMGDEAVILHGAPQNADLDVQVAQIAGLYSTVHGAGRVMGRAQAKGKKDKKTGEWKREPRITHEEWRAWTEAQGVTVRGGDVDEAPQAYRRLPHVIKALQGTVELEQVLSPRIVVMAGD